jgi:sugar lactone lactonase YvrE
MASFLRSRRIATMFLLVVLLACGRDAHATFSLTFQGTVQTINTGGSITLSSPSSIVVDSAGDIFIADTVSGSGRIVEVNAQGTASVLTISGLSPALGSLSSIAIDGAGNLYIADTGNTRVVKVSSSGAGSVISTGSVTLTAPHGVAVDQSEDLFISDGNRIVEVTSGGAAAALTINVSASTTTLSSPEGLAVGVSGKLYIADYGNNRIVTVASGSTTGAVLSTGDLSPLSNPSAVAVDRVGNVFIGDTGNNRIAEVDTAGNGYLLLSSDVLALSEPLGVAVDVFGGVYIADTGHSRALLVDPYLDGDSGNADYTSSLNKTAVGFGHITLGSSTPTSLFLSFTVGSPLVENLGGAKVLTSGTQGLDFQLVSGANTTCSSSTESGSYCTVEVSFLPTAPGLRKGALVLYDPDSNPVLTVPLYGFGDAPVAALSPNTGAVIGTGGLPLSDPYQVALDGAGNMYVGDYTGKNVTKIPAGGGSATLVSLGTPGSVAVQNITGVAVDGAGNLFIGDHQNSRILVVTPGGVVSVLSITGPSLGFPTALAFDAAGNLYIADFTNGQIIEVSSLFVSGSTSTGLGTVIPAGGYSFTGSTLTGLTIDSQGNIYAASRTQNNSSIIKVTASGVASELAIPNNITPALSNPQGVAADAMGNIYIVDTNNNRIVKLTTAGVASVLKLSGLPSPSSLGSLLFGVTVDPSGNLYIPDWTNSRLVFVNVSGAPLTFPTPTGAGTTDTVDGPQTATVTNLGNQPLVFSANPTYTANFSSNGNDTNPCTSSTSLSPGTVCDVSVNFTPQSAGSLSAGINVTNNTLNVPSSTEQVSVSGTGLITSDSTATAVSTNPTSVVSGQSVTITATVADTATGHTSNSPSGSVSFTDTLGSTVTSLNNGAAVNFNSKVGSLNAVVFSAVLSGVGTHTITAVYGGSEGQYTTSSGSVTVVVGKASVTVTGPAVQPISLSPGQAGSATITVTAPYTTIAAPSGSITYTILNAFGTSVTSGNLALTTGSGSSTATVLIPSSLAPGSYTISITYGGDSNYAAPSTATTISLQISQLTPIITWTPASSSIPYGTALSTALLNASAHSGANAVQGAFTYVATSAGGAPVTVTSASVLPAGSYTLTVTFIPTDTTAYATVTAHVPLTIGQATSALTLTSSASSVVLTNPLVFTATVSSSTTTPTGTVSFLDGTTPLGQGTLSNGVAALSTSALTAGSHTITAVYSGDANFSAAISGALSETVLDFSLNNAGGSGGASGSGTSASQTVTPGGTANYPLTILPTNGTVFPAPITLSLTGLPPGATATIAPSTWTQLTSTTWSFPANIALPATALAVQTPSAVARLEPGAELHRTLPPVLLGLLLLPLAGVRRRLGKTLGRTIFTLLLLLAGASAMAGLSGCGANSGFFGQPSQTYTMTVTATSGSLSHATTVTLTLQ